ncbi:MAG: hypothetical protein ACLP1Q_05970 [Solirubrobacteraceae bacterium]
MGDSKIPIRLGPDGDPVMGIQFFDVEEPADRTVVEEQPATPQGLAIFSDMARLKQKVKKSAERQESEMTEMRTKVDRTERATNQVVLFGVFLVAASLLGAFGAFIVAVVAGGNAAPNRVEALNQLNASRPWTIVILVSLVIVAITCVALLSRMMCQLYIRISRGQAARTERTRSGGGSATAVPGVGEQGQQRTAASD